MIRYETIRRRLEKLDEYLSYLEKAKDYQQTDFLNNAQIWASTERFLQMAIEAINDIASHIIAEENIGTIDQYRDIPELFLKKHYIDNELKEKWIRMIGFRNILVHGYIDINRSEVYIIIHHNLDDIIKLRKVFANFL